ncbi:MAG: transcriptional activator protein, partial [Gemmatimonadetes bacterium]|nr:transcriptional activator protein [Gemmatimonadota bacterium]
MALLAILGVARGRPVGRERIIGLLWPESPSDAARHLLSESLSVFRKELGDAAVVTTGDEVGLSAAAVGSDVADFETAAGAGEWERAAGLYGGPLLDGFYVDDAPGFERWAEGERDRLARVFAGVLERMAAAAEAEGSALRAVDWRRRLAAQDPYSSRAALGLARALEVAGERASAARALATHAALLREELGVEPDAEVAAFARRLRTPAAPAPPRPEVDPPSTACTASVDEDAPASRLNARGGAESIERVPASDPIAARTGGASTGTALSRAAATDFGTGAGGERKRSDAVERGARTRRRKRVSLTHAALAGMVAGVVLSALVATRPRGNEAPAAEGADPRRIAVLYFDDDTPGGGMRYLADGLTEDLIHQLGEVDGLRMASRNAVKAYRDGRQPLDSLVARLRVGSLVEGSVQRAGDSVRVMVQLVDAATQTRIESRSVTRPVGELFALEDALAGEVAGFLRRRVGRQVRLREARAETASDTARALVFHAEQARGEARALWDARDAMDVGSVDRLLLHADSLLAAAEAADPRWTRPTVLRGWTSLALATYGGRPGRLPRAAAFAERALA